MKLVGCALGVTLGFACALGSVAFSEVETLEAIQTRATAGDAVAQNRLGVILFEGKEVTQDIEAALGWFGRAARSGNSDAMFNLGEAYTSVSVASGPHRTLAPSDNMRGAREWWEKAAMLEHPHAKVRLGFYREIGAGGLQEDAAEAVRLYEEAAAAGSVEAANALGGLLEVGRNGIARDEARSIGYYIAAFDGKLGEDAKARIIPDWSFGIAQRNAQERLEKSFFYFGGLDRRTVARLTRALAERGFVQHQRQLAGMLQSGDGLPRDLVEAASWYAKAAERGSYESQVALGLMHQNGEGVARDSHKALLWLTRAANNPEAFCSGFEAIARIAQMYENGHGVARDLREASSWYRRAAELGSPIFQRLLAKKYEFGHGLPKDLVEAHAWYNVASAEGDAEARARLTIVERSMGAAQITQATKLAKERFEKCRPSPQLRWLEKEKL